MKRFIEWLIASSVPAADERELVATDTRLVVAHWLHLDADYEASREEAFAWPDFTLVPLTDDYHACQYAARPVEIDSWRHGTVSVEIVDRSPRLDAEARDAARGRRIH